jgi:hypothetical protein
MTITGHCHCGGIQYKAEGPIVKTSYCDCPGCQKATGTLQAPFVTVLRGNTEVTAGEPSVFRAKSGDRCDEHGEWLFCPDCGTQVFWRGFRGNELDIFAGTLNDPSVFQPPE